MKKEIKKQINQTLKKLNYIDSDIEPGVTYYYQVSGVDIHGNEGVASGVADETGETLSVGDVLPDEFMLYSAYPNPFNPTTTVKFVISKISSVDINIYDMNGNFIDNLVSTSMMPGKYEVIWDASNLPSGVYLIHMNTLNEVFTEKVLLVK